MSKLRNEIEALKSSLAVPRPPVSVAIEKPVTVASGIPAQHSQTIPRSRLLVVLLILILALLGALLLAQLAVSNVVGVPATVLVVPPSPYGPPESTVVASASFTFPSFASGKSCSEAVPLPADYWPVEHKKQLAAFLESALCPSTGYDAWTVVGGHDSQELKPTAMALYKSNQGLALHRADCIKRYVEIVAQSLQGRCSHLPSTLVLATKPSSDMVLPHSEPVKEIDRSGLVIFYRKNSGESR